MDDQTQDVAVPIEVVPMPETPVSSQPTASMPDDVPPEALESPTSVSASVPVESQNGWVNPSESEVPVSSNNTPTSEPVQSIPTEFTPSAPAPLTPQAPQAQSPVQPDQAGFIHALLAKAQAKIQSNKQKKLDKIIVFTQKKKIVANEDIQLLLHISSATATRYLAKLVQQCHLARVGNPRDAKYNSCARMVLWLKWWN